MKTATQLADILGGIKASEINEALISLGLIKKVDSGYETLSKLGIQKEFQEKKYVIWEDNIVEVLEAHFKKPSVEVAETMTATQIGVEVGLSAKEVNQLLVEINFLNRGKKGFFSQNALAEQCLTKDGVSYVKWQRAILENPVFKREIENSQENKEEFKKEVASKEADAFKFDRKTFDAKFRTQSGHFVRSRAEVIVADWLYNNDIMFAYEKRLPIIEEVYSDFFIKEKKIYIEVWGLEDTKYLDRKEVKINLYNKHNFNLIGLSDRDIENIDDFLPIKLAQMGITF